MFDIRLLGPPLVHLNGGLFPVTRRATRALFFYLAAHENPVGRDKLRDLLWGEDIAPSKQATRFRVALSQLKDAFPEDMEVVQTYHDLVGLNPNLIRVDLHQFNAVLNKMQHYTTLWQGEKAFPLSLYQEMIDAARLWQGENFIDNGDFTQLSQTAIFWWQQQNEALRKKRRSLYKFLAQLEDAYGKTEEAIAWAEEAIALEALDEEAHFLILQSLHRSGQIERGRQYYRFLVDEVEPDLGGELSTRIRALGRRLSQQRVASPSQERSEWAVHPSVYTPFVGQNGALNILNTNLHRGKPTLIVGESGAGKTRLAQEFYNSLTHKPQRFLLACRLSDENIPYRPWTKLLQNDVDKTLWQQLPAQSLKPLTMIYPELKEIRPELRDVKENSYATAIVFSAIKKLLKAVASTNSVLLFVDDIHWADQASLLLLFCLIEEAVFRDENIQLILASRVAERGDTLNRLLNKVLKNELALIELQRLKEKDIHELAFHVLRKKVSDEFAARLLRGSGGNPFFVLEILADLSALPPEKQTHNMPLPESLIKIVKKKTGKLSAPAQAFLLIAAVQGNPFRLDVVEKAAELAPRSVTTIVGELEKAQLIQEDDENHARYYKFIHDKIRENLLDSLPSLEKHLIHYKLAKTLEAMGHSNPAILARHYEKAENYSRAFALWIEAGRHAYHLRSVDDAHSIYLRAERLISQAALSNEEIHRLYLHWGNMLFVTDDPDRLEKAMERLSELGHARHSDLLIGAALDGFSNMCMARNQFEKGLDYVEKALPYLEQSKNIIALAQAYIHRGVFTYMLGQFPKAQKDFQEVLRLIENPQEPETLTLLGDAHYQMAVTWVGMGYPAKGLEAGEKARHNLILGKKISGPVTAHVILSLAHYYLTNYEEGRDEALQGLKLAKQNDNWRLLGYLSSYAAFNEVELARLGDAWEHAHQAITVGEKHKHSEITGMGYKALGDLYTRLNDLEKATVYYQKGVDVDEDTSFVKLENLARLGLILSLRDNPKGDALLQQAFGYAQKSGLEVILYNTQAIQLGIFLQRGDLKAFNKQYPRVEKALQERSHPNTLLWLTYLNCIAAFQRGEAEKSLEMVETLLAQLKNASLFWIEWRALKHAIQLGNQLDLKTASKQKKLQEMVQKIEIGNAPPELKTSWENFLAAMPPEEKSKDPSPPSKEEEILTFLHKQVFDPVLQNAHASDTLKEGVRATIKEIQALDAAEMIAYYWEAITGTEESIAFAEKMKAEGFSRFEELIDEFRQRFNKSWLDE